LEARPFAMRLPRHAMPCQISKALNQELQLPREIPTVPKY
jgi:hypothetical protein